MLQALNVTQGGPAEEGSCLSGDRVHEHLRPSAGGSGRGHTEEQLEEAPHFSAASVPSRNAAPTSVSRNAAADAFRAALAVLNNCTNQVPAESAAALPQQRNSKVVWPAENARAGSLKEPWRPEGQVAVRNDAVCEVEGQTSEVYQTFLKQQVSKVRELPLKLKVQPSKVLSNMLQLCSQLASARGHFMFPTCFARRNWGKQLYPGHDCDTMEDCERAPKCAMCVHQGLADDLLAKSDRGIECYMDRMPSSMQMSVTCVYTRSRLPTALFFQGDPDYLVGTRLPLTAQHRTFLSMKL